MRNFFLSCARRLVRFMEIPFNIYLLNLKRRFSKGTVLIFKKRLAFPDSASCVSIYRDIFKRKLYAFRCERPEPVIIDLGSNIGMSVIFFKRLYPKARITAVEADPCVFHYLERNLAAFEIKDVCLINAAAHDCVAQLGFFSEGADGGHVAEGKQASCKIPAIDTRALLEEKPVIDMLKMDIEGAEGTVLRHCAPALGRVKNIYVEHHGGVCPVSLGEILCLLEEAGFDCQVRQVEDGDAPFLGMLDEKRKTSCADQYHIFGIKREGCGLP